MVNLIRWVGLKQLISIAYLWQADLLAPWNQNQLRIYNSIKDACLHFVHTYVINIYFHLTANYYTSVSRKVKGTLSLQKLH